MASTRQIAANRANARKSTGPRSAAGKATAARNAYQHGIFAREALAAFEDFDAFVELGERMREALAPEGPLEEALFERIVGCTWRVQRIVRLESEMIAGTGRGLGERGPLDCGWLRHVEADRLRLFSQYEARLDRMLHRALRELQRAQAARRGADLAPPLVIDVDVSGLPEEPQARQAASLEAAIGAKRATPRSGASRSRAPSAAAPAAPGRSAVPANPGEIAQRLRPVILDALSTMRAGSAPASLEPPQRQRVASAGRGPPS
jgi:hypothetical protein